MVVIARGFRSPVTSHLKGIHAESVMVAMVVSPDLVSPQCRGLRNLKMRRDGSFKAASERKTMMALVCISLVAHSRFSPHTLNELHHVKHHVRSEDLDTTTPSLLLRLP
jgi:hypothetical protein